MNESQLKRRGECRTRMLFRCGFRALMLLGFLLGTPTEAADGDVIWIRGREAPIYGRVVATTNDEVEFRAFQNGGLGPVTKIQLIQVEQLLVNFDSKRLERLNPNQPKDFRDYAEELMPQSADPVARNLARRLLLIAAFQSSQESSQQVNPENDVLDGALEMLVQLADSDEERSRLEVFRFVVSPNKQANPLKQLTSKQPSAGQAKLMLELIQSIRREKSNQARSLLSSPDNRDVFRLWKESISLDSLDQAAKVNRPSRAQLSELLKVEAAILQAENGVYLVQFEDSRNRKWGDFAVDSSTKLSGIPRFENLIDLDPRASIFRDGNWIRPN